MTTEELKDTHVHNAELCQYCIGFYTAIRTIEEIIKECRRCPNCNEGDPKKCCIDYVDLMAKIMEMKNA